MGTAFHSWVEDFIISEVDDAPAEISELTEIFKNSRFHGQSPVDVEIEINLTRGQNTFVCKLDAVFQVGDRFEIVDWKTGSAPKDKQTEQQMILQLALYRFAYSELKQIPIEQIDVCFYFVGENIELRPEKVPGPEQLLKMWEELFV
jgi:DNA helicase-2/ATP-dependent DNA helicase PcrA